MSIIKKNSGIFGFLKNMVDVHSCLSISWDQNWFVYGAVLAKSGRRLKITAHASCKDRVMTFSERLKKVYDELNGKEQARVLLGGCLPHAFILLLDTPPLKPSEIDKFLSYELPRHLPYNNEDLIWAFRPVFFTPSLKTKTEKIKVMCITRALLQNLTADIIASEIKFDTILHPYFVTEPLYTGTKLFLNSMNDSFYSDSDELQGWYMSPVPTEQRALDKLIEERDFVFDTYREYIKENFDRYIPCIVLAEYGLSHNFVIDSRYGFKIPAECKPKRFRGLKMSALFLALGFCIIFGGHTIRDAINQYKALSELKMQKAKLVAEDISLRKKITEGQLTGTIIQQVFSSVPNDIEVLDFLEYLTKTVSSDIWLNYLNTYGNSANLTFQTDGSSDKMISDFYKSENYTLQNSRKNKSGDGIEYIYINFVKKEKNIKDTDASDNES